MCISLYSSLDSSLDSSFSSRVNARVPPSATPAGAPAARRCVRSSPRSNTRLIRAYGLKRRQSVRHILAAARSNAAALRAQHRSLVGIDIGGKMVPWRFPVQRIREQFAVEITRHQLRLSSLAACCTRFHFATGQAGRFLHRSFLGLLNALGGVGIMLSIDYWHNPLPI